MYDIINKEKEIDEQNLNQDVKQLQKKLEEQFEAEESEIEDDLFDQNILMKLKFQQVSERKSWQGINVMYSGIPGTSTLVQNERILMFQEERDEIESQQKIIDILIDIYEIYITSLYATNNFTCTQNSNSQNIKST